MTKYNKAIAAAIMALSAWLVRRFDIDFGFQADEVEAVLLILIPVVVWAVRNSGYVHLDELPANVRREAARVVGDT